MAKELIYLLIYLPFITIPLIAPVDTVASEAPQIATTLLTINVMLFGFLLLFVTVVLYRLRNIFEIAIWTIYSYLIFMSIPLSFIFLNALFFFLAGVGKIEDWAIVLKLNMAGFGVTLAGFLILIAHLGAPFLALVKKLRKEKAEKINNEVIHLKENEKKEKEKG